MLEEGEEVVVGVTLAMTLQISMEEMHHMEGLEEEETTPTRAATMDQRMHMAIAMGTWEEVGQVAGGQGALRQKLAIVARQK